MNKKKFGLLYCVLTFSLLLVACSNDQQTALSIDNSVNNTSLQTEETVSPSDVPVATTEIRPNADSSNDVKDFGLMIENEQQESELASQVDAAPVPEPSDIISTQTSTIDNNMIAEEADTEVKINVQIGSSTFIATLEENAAVDALMAMLEQGPVTIKMSDYSGFEKVGSLGFSLPTNDSQTTTQAGDIILYQGNQLVIFYGSNTWSYTILGRIDDLTGLEEALGSGDITVTLSTET